MLSLSEEQRRDECISHALKVRLAHAENDYHSFFRLKESCPNHGAYLMDFIVPLMRNIAIQRIIKAYRPSISVSFVLQELGYFKKEQQVEGKSWLEKHGCKFSDDFNVILTKESKLNENEQCMKNAKKNSLI